MTKKTLIMVVLVIALLGLYTGKVTAREATGSGLLHQNKLEERIDTVKSKALQEIDRRVAAVNTIIARINAMKRLSDSQKAGFVAQANQLLADLGTLKAKITADTDAESLKTDRKSIFNSYRVYMLFIPRMNIVVGADRILEIVDQVTVILPKLQSNGKDVTNIEAKLADAKTQAQNAINAVISLVPDGGNTATLQANNAAIKSARNMVHAAMTDLKAVRGDLRTIHQGIHEKAKPGNG
jgi:hypothetical protein